MRTLSYLDPAPVSSRYHLKSTCSNRNIKTSILPLITKGEGKSVSRSNTIHHILCVGSSLLTEYLDKNILHTLPLSGNNYIYIYISLYTLSSFKQRCLPTLNNHTNPVPDELG